MSYEQGDIILVPFPFTNLKKQKVRPALVVSKRNAPHSDLVICGITSQNDPKQSQVTLHAEDFVDKDLPLQSYVRTRKLVSLHQSIAIKRIARLNAACVQTVLSSLLAHFR